MKFQKLLWTIDGFQLEGYNWTNYVPYRHNFMLEHDIYHHRPNESGLYIEEFRAVVVSYTRKYYKDFDSCAFSIYAREHLSLLKLGDNQYDSIKLDFTYGDLPEFFKDFAYYESGSKNTKKLITVILDGFQYGLKYRTSSFGTIEHQTYYHDLGCNLIVNRETGSVTYEKNS